METDIWGQLALEATSVYLTDGDAAAGAASKRHPFHNTVLYEITNIHTAHDFYTKNQTKKDNVYFNWC